MVTYLQYVLVMVAQSFRVTNQYLIGFNAYSYDMEPIPDFTWVVKNLRLERPREKPNTILLHS